MPRQDGTPTAAERRDAERVARNADFIATRSDADLVHLRSDQLLDEKTVAQVAAEITRRGL